MKGQISLIEMIIVVAILFVSFSIFFPGTNFDSGWGDADLILESRDLSTVMDQKTYGHPITSMKNVSTILNNYIPERNPIWWATVEETFQPDILVACACTTEQIGELSKAVDRVKLNDRNITVDFVRTELEVIPDSHALIIWGETQLDDYEKTLLSYMGNGSGIISIANIQNNGDFDGTYADIFNMKAAAPPVKDNSVAGTIFNTYSLETSEIDVSSPSYQVFKMFHNMPVRVQSEADPEIDPVEFSEDSVLDCTSTNPMRVGYLTFRTNNVTWWSCQEADGDKILIDTDCNTPTNLDINGDEIPSPDIILSEGDEFSLNCEFPINGFELNYLVTSNKENEDDFVIGGIAEMYISMPSIASDNSLTDSPFLPKPDPYSFLDFSYGYSAVGPGDNTVYPRDDDQDKIVLRSDVYISTTNPVPAVMVNNDTASSKAYWIAGSIMDVNQDETGAAAAEAITDDEKLLLTSVIFDASNKKGKDLFASNLGIANVELGFVSPRVYVANRDMFEPYRLDVGLGFPF